MQSIYIQVDAQKELFMELAEITPEGIEIIEAKKSDASLSMLEVIVTLSSITIPLIAKIIIEQIRSKKHIVVKHKGMEIKGLSEEKTEELLKKLLKD